LKLIVRIKCNMDLSLCLCFVLVCHKHMHIRNPLVTIMPVIDWNSLLQTKSSSVTS
jgi:hypothetical protein